jgi:hypothetical protein
MKKRKSNVTYVRKGFAQDPEGKKPLKFEVCDYSCVENSNMKRSMTSAQGGKKQHCWKYFSPSANFRMISCKIFHPIGSHDSIMELTVH